jgi:hypothetical protein
MKRCPFCQEQIQDAAMKCRYCGEILDESLRALERKRKRGRLSVKQVVFGILWSVIFFIGSCFVAGMIVGNMAAKRDPAHAMEAARRAGERLGETLGPLFLVGSVVLSAVGTWFGVLPGTRAPRDI